MPGTLITLDYCLYNKRVPNEMNPEPKIGDASLADGCNQYHLKQLPLNLKAGCLTVNLYYISINLHRHKYINSRL